MEQAKRLSGALADRYRIEREIGEGGMATVYLAQDLRHERPVAIKVLKPELAAIIGAKRFLAEIKTTANLQHPHILPLFDSGEAEGFLFYVMPYVEGESLRDRLAREAKLPLDEAVRIVGEVAEALQAAHEQGVVHRDIKPANILLSRGQALVTDFGIALAASEVGDTRLTATGLSMGTPQYMSPEQWSGKDVDARTDVYALGCVLFEILTGEPPFPGTSAQATLGKVLGGEPPAVTQAKPMVPQEIVEVITRSLAKSPADRFRTMGDMAAALALTTMPTQPSAVGLPPQDRPLWQIFAGWFVASLVIWATTLILTEVVGLPSWVPTVAGLICLGALPLALGAALTLHQRLTWRMAGLVVGVAFALLATGTSGYMATRVMGIGPVGTLWAKGVLEAEEPIVLADFGTRSVDSVLVFTVTDAFRVDLSQSLTVKLADQARVAEVLGLMLRDPTQPLDLETAREVAIREGLKAVIAGEVNALGAGFVLSVRLVAAETGEELVSFRETAADPDAIIPAIERLSRRLRERIGESLKMVRLTQPLDQVRTASLEALRLYTEGNRANSRGDYERSVTLLTDAIAIDTLFARAYYIRGLAGRNLGRNEYQSDLVRAYELRDRMAGLGRAWATASYHSSVRGEDDKAAEALEAYLDVYPDALGPLNNLSVYYRSLRDYARAEEVLRRLFEGRRTPTAINWSNLSFAQFDQGKFQEAEETLRRWEEAMPGNSQFMRDHLTHTIARWDYKGAWAILDTLGQSGTPNLRAWASGRRAYLARAQGKVGEAERHAQDAGWSAYERLEWLAFSRLLSACDTAGAEALMEEGLASVDSLAPTDKPYLDPAEFYARAGQPERARQFLAEWDRVTDEHRKLRERAERRGEEGLVVLAEGRPQEAIPLLRLANERMRWSPIAYLPDLGMAYEQAGEPDSALVHYERYVNTPYSGRYGYNALWLPMVYERLAALYEERGDVEMAVEYYGRFVNLWAEADAELQPRVEAARRALERLESGSSEAPGGD